MQNKGRYPGIGVRSKNELAKRISGNGLTYEAALALINDVLINYDSYWRDQPKRSQPEKAKWVRDASYTSLGRLLKLINERVLKPYDYMLPGFIFGGVAGKNHKAAAKELLGRRRQRVLLKLDVSHFFEQIQHERVEKFFATRAECGKVGSRLLADLCCVANGAKESPRETKSIARGFATSSRLAVWCNLDTFMRLNWLVQRELRGKDPKIAIYVDDIGITASKATTADMAQLYHKVKALLERDRNQQLPLNDKKTKIVFHSGDTYDIDGNYKGKWAFEILGQQLKRNSLGIGSKSRWKLSELTHKIKTAGKPVPGLRKQKKSMSRYKSYIET